MFKRLCKIVSPLGNGVVVVCVDAVPPRSNFLVSDWKQTCLGAPHPWMKVGPQSPGPACRVGSLGALPGGLRGHTCQDRKSSSPSRIPLSGHSFPFLQRGTLDPGSALPLGVLLAGEGGVTARHMGVGTQVEKETPVRASSALRNQEGRSLLPLKISKGRRPCSLRLLGLFSASPVSGLIKPAPNVLLVLPPPSPPVWTKGGSSLHLVRL